MARIFYDRDADIDILKDRKISIIGYGNQGRAQALNMKDSGLKNIIVGNRQDESWDRAKKDGFDVYTVEEACSRSDVMFMLIPDEIAPEIYRQRIEPYLKNGDVLNFASGYNITFKRIVPPDFTDIVMVAPRMIGEGVREGYMNGTGFPSFVAVEKDASGKAGEIAPAIAKAIGSTKKGAIEVTFNEETYIDLLAEQAIWPLILSVMTQAYKFEVDMGLSEEAVLMDLYLSGEPAVMMQKMADVGLFRQLPLHSHTSQYGQLSRFEEVDGNYIRNFLARQFENIRSGRFAQEWKAEQENGLAKFGGLLEKALDSDISREEEKLKKRLNEV